MSGFNEFVKKVTHPHFHHHEDHGKKAAENLQDKHHHGPNCSHNEANKEVSPKYLHDPMRASPKPDTVGNYKDPMGKSDHSSYDPTNTGA
ncbi:hypothetical protein BJ944DRAFT_273328 [Cunninghamella echinulata]|nr:hypothetical protein BJ944DRAFT_273328 [Cunninghamella echinulata]